MTIRVLKDDACAKPDQGSRKDAKAPRDSLKTKNPAV